MIISCVGQSRNCYNITSVFLMIRCGHVIGVGFTILRVVKDSNRNYSSCPVFIFSIVSKEEHRSHNPHRCIEIFYGDCDCQFSPILRIRLTSFRHTSSGFSDVRMSTIFLEMSDDFVRVH